jgi:hypothetical protein
MPETIAQLDQLIDEQGEDSTSDNMTVYRGVGPRGGGQDHWTEPGYLSATEDRNIAWDFAGDEGDRILEIRVPEGQRFFRVPEGAYEYYQSEVIFPRGTEFRRENDGTYTAITHYKKPPLPPVQAAAWNEADHPRYPAGDERGGEFAPKLLATEARKPGLQKDGRYRISGAGEIPREALLHWLQDQYQTREMRQALMAWPDLNPEQAALVRDYLAHHKNRLDERGMGKLRQEAKYVLRDLGLPVDAPPGPVPPVETLMQQRYTRSLLDTLAIGGGRAHEFMLEAARTIDGTILYPKVPGEPEVTLKGVPGGQSRQAAFWRTKGTQRPNKITVAATGVDPVSSTVHELGHYLDSLIGQDEWSGKEFTSPEKLSEMRNEWRRLSNEAVRATTATERVRLRGQASEALLKLEQASPPQSWKTYSSEQFAGTLGPVVKAITETQMYKQLAKEVRGPAGGALFEYGGRVHAAPTSHIRYLMKPPEMIARSFEQYVASKNPTSKLASGSRHSGSPQWPGYMVGSDLTKVNAVWDEVLRKRGLLKERA